MKAARIIIVTFFLCFSYSAHSQIADGNYLIHHVGQHNDKDKSAEYHTDTPEGSYIIFNNENIFITIGNYRVDIIKYDDNDTDYSESMAQIKAYSYYDNKDKIAFIQTLEKGLYQFWLERGNGSADVFLFTTPDYKK